MRKIDNIDKQILNALSQNSRIQLKQLAQQIHLSSPAIGSRIERLEKDGYIVGYSTILDYEKLDKPIIAFIQLTVDPEMRSSFQAFINPKKEVLECYHVAGAYSMLMKVCFSTPSKLNEFVGSLQTYGKTETQIVFSCIIPPRNILLKDE